MNLIMIDHADKTWVRSYRELDEVAVMPEHAIAKLDKVALIGIVVTIIGFVMVLCVIVLTVNKTNPVDALDDCVLSPDIQSFISTSKEPVTLELEDTQ